MKTILLLIKCVALALVVLMTDVSKGQVASFKDGLKVGAKGQPNSKAILDVVSTTKGFLPPRMTEAQRNAISSPPAGLLIFNTDTATLNQYDGSSWGAVAGAASGAQYNVLTNFGFEDSDFDADWTASGGTLAAAAGTNILFGDQSATWDSNGASQTLSYAAITIGEGFKSNNCEGAIYVKTPSGTATHTLQVHDGTNVIASASVISRANAIEVSTGPFPCPTSGTWTLRLVSVNADEPLIAVDDAYLGIARNVGTVRQATHKGSIRMTGCTDWSRSNTSFGSFTATSGCSYTVTGDVIAPSTVIPGFRLQNVAPGRYLIFARGSWFKSVTTTNADIYLRFNDGTNSFGEQAVEGGASSSGQSAQSSSHLSGAITYSTAQSTLTIQLQGLTTNTTSSTAINISDDGGPGLSSAYSEGLQFDVYYFPTDAQTVVYPEAQGWFVDATIAGANPSLGVAAVSSYTEITSASLTMLPRSGSAPVGIMCSSTNAAATPSTSSTTCSAGSESVGVNFNLPKVGAYKVCAYFGHFVQVDTSEAVSTTFQLIETPTNAQTEIQQGGTRVNGGYTAGSATSTNQASIYPHTSCSIFNFSSVGTKGVRLMYEQAVSGTPNNSFLLGDQDTATGQRDIRITVEPVSGQQQALLANSVSTGVANGDKIGAAELDCDSSSSIVRNRQSMVSSIGNISAGSCVVTLTTGYFSGIPDCQFTWDGSGNNQIVFTTCSSATACSVGSITDTGAANTTTQGQLFCLGPK